MFSVQFPVGLTGYLIFLQSFIRFPFVENKRGFIICNQCVTDNITEICTIPAIACRIAKRLLLFVVPCLKQKHYIWCPGDVEFYFQELKLDEYIDSVFQMCGAWGSVVVKALPY